MTALKTLFLLAVTALGLALSVPARAIDTPTCPATFPTKSLRLSPLDDGWSADTGRPAPLVSMGLFSGPPSQGAMLQPTTANGISVSWTLEPPYPQGIWLQCDYAGGALTLQKPLSTIPKTCVAKYGKAQTVKPRSIEFSCR